MESWVTMGNLLITAGIINVTNVDFDFPLEGSYENELEFEGEYELELEYEGFYEDG